MDNLSLFRDKSLNSCPPLPSTKREGRGHKKGDLLFALMMAFLLLYVA